MVASNWVNLEGQIIGQKYLLTHLVEPGSQEARFSAEAADGSTQNGFVIAVSTRHKEAAIRPEELRHPNLRRVFASGTDTVQGLELRYLVLESVNETLADALRAGPLEERAARELALDIVSALDHLHARGYVYAGLKPSAVARSDRGWVLSDFDLLRRKGTVDPAETRLMLATSPHVPPDAYSGLVSPAWDLWSLGVVLNQSLTDAPRSGRRSRPSPAPPPFDSIIRGCLDPDPNERIGLRDVAGLLGTELSSRVERTSERSPHPEAPPAAAETNSPPSRPRVNGFAGSDGTSGMKSSVLAAPNRLPERRRSRIYPAPAGERPVQTSAPEPEFDTSAPDLEEIPSRWERIGPRGRRWVIVAVGLLALSVGALLAILNTGSQREQANGIGEEFPNSAERDNASRALPQEKPPDPSPPMDQAERKAAIIPFLIDWARSMRELDLEGHVSSYAPVVDVFFTKRAVPISEVRAEKEKLFSGISTVRRLGVRDIRIESFEPERAVVNLRKDWDFRGRLGTAGAERERLTLQWIDGRWRITGEQEITVYWTRKPRPTKGD